MKSTRIYYQILVTIIVALCFQFTGNATGVYDVSHTNTTTYLKTQSVFESNDGYYSKFTNIEKTQGDYLEFWEELIEEKDELDTIPSLHISAIPNAYYSFQKTTAFLKLGSKQVINVNNSGLRLSLYIYFQVFRI